MQVDDWCVLDSWVEIGNLVVFEVVVSFESAEDAYNRCLELIRSPDSKSTIFFYRKDFVEVNALLNLAAFRIHSGRYADAKKFFERAAAADTNHQNSLLMDDGLEKVDALIKSQRESSSK